VGGSPHQDERGLVPLRYRADDDRTYTVRPEELEPLEAAPAEAIHLWVATAASTADAAGVAALLRWGDHVRERSRRADAAPPEALWARAVLLGLTSVRRPDLPVRLHGPLPEPEVLPPGLSAALRRVVEGLNVIPSTPDTSSPEALRAAQVARDAATP
jgi:hypothetical protein